MKVRELLKKCDFFIYKYELKRIDKTFFDEWCYQYSKFEDIPEELLEEDVKSFNVKWSYEETKNTYLGRKIIVEIE